MQQEEGFIYYSTVCNKYDRLLGVVVMQQISIKKCLFSY